MSDEVSMPGRSRPSEYRRAQRHIEAVANRLDVSLRDQAAAAHGWHRLGLLWRAAERNVNCAEVCFAWWAAAQGDEQESEPDVRPHLLNAAASLLDLASMVESMRRASR